MLDRYTQQAIRPLIHGAAQLLHRAGIAANTLTWLGWAIGLLSALAIAQQQYALGLALLLVSRLCDGLDGAVARLGTPSHAGGFLDITLDFWFYAAIPLAFAWADPVRNALPAACLLAAFIGTGTSFLAYAVMQEKSSKPTHTANEEPQQQQQQQQQDQDTPKRDQAQPTQHPSRINKSFYFLGGLTEATETLAFFIAMCLWPMHFPTLAYVFALLCMLTSVTRIRAGLRDL